MKAELKYIEEVSGEQYVMIIGISWMPEWCADN